MYLKIHNSLCCAVLTFALVACASTKMGDRSSNTRQFLSNLDGQYPNSVTSGRPRYSRLTEIARFVDSQPREVVLGELIDCLDSTDLTQSSFDGQRLPLGIICNEALGVLAYFETADSNGDLVSNQKRLLHPDSSIEELRETKRLWIDVLDRNTYVFQ